MPIDAYTAFEKMGMLRKLGSAECEVLMTIGEIEVCSPVTGYVGHYNEVMFSSNMLHKYGRKIEIVKIHSFLDLP